LDQIETPVAPAGIWWSEDRNAGVSSCRDVAGVAGRTTVPSVVVVVARVVRGKLEQEDADEQNAQQHRAADMTRAQHR